MASPSRTTDRTGSARAAADQLGHARGDVVQAAGEDGDRRRRGAPAPGRRRASTRRRRAEPAPAPRRRSARCGEHRQQRAADLQPERAQAGRAVGQRGRGHRAAGRRAASAPGARSAAGTPAARATASTITPSSAPWRSSPTSSPTRNRCSSAVARAEQPREQPPPRALRAGAGQRGRSARGARRPRPPSGSARRPAAGRSRSAAQPTPIWRCRSSPERNATRRRTSSGSSARAGTPPAARPWPGGRGWRRRPRRWRRRRRAAPGHCPRMPGAVDNLAHPGPVLGVAGPLRRARTRRVGVRAGPGDGGAIASPA